MAKIKHMCLPDLRVLTATFVVLFHRPSYTSPNCPWPILRSSRSELLGISHWSFVLYDNPNVCGFSNCNNHFHKYIATNCKHYQCTVNSISASASRVGHYGAIQMLYYYYYYKRHIFNANVNQVCWYATITVEVHWLYSLPLTYTRTDLRPMSK